MYIEMHKKRTLFNDFSFSLYMKTTKVEMSMTYIYLKNISLENNAIKTKSYEE